MTDENAILRMMVTSLSVHIMCLVSLSNGRFPKVEQTSRELAQTSLAYVKDLK